MAEEGDRTASQLEEVAQLPAEAAKPFMGLVKMGPGFKIGYAIRDNFSGTAHLETKLHASGETYKH